MRELGKIICTKARRQFSDPAEVTPSLINSY